MHLRTDESFEALCFQGAEEGTKIGTRFHESWSLGYWFPRSFKALLKLPLVDQFVFACTYELVGHASHTRNDSTKADIWFQKLVQVLGWNWAQHDNGSIYLGHPSRS